MPGGGLSTYRGLCSGVCRPKRGQRNAAGPQYVVQMTTSSDLSKVDLTRRGLLAGAGVLTGVAALGLNALTAPSASAAGVCVWPNGTNTRPAISSPFGPRTAPTGGASSDHKGTDFVGFATVRAVAAGVVSVTGTPAGWGGGGTQVWIQHDDGFVSRSFHLAPGTVSVSPQQRVQAGDALGTMGRSGTATGVHHHLEIVVGGVQIDPVPFLTARVGGTVTPPDQVRAAKEFAVHNGSWSAIPVGFNMSEKFTTVNMGSGWGDLYGSFGGSLRYVGVSGGAWTQMDSGLPLNASSISAVDVGQSFPHIFAVENSILYHIYADGSGWHKVSTGLTVPGKISAVVLPNNNVQIVANISGVMHHVTTHSGWEIGNSGVPIGGEFKAVNIGGSLQIATLLNGVVHIIWPGAGWQLQSTGVGSSGSLTAVDMGGGFPTIITNEGWSVCVTSVSGGGWVRQATGVSVSGNIDAIRTSGGFPTVYAV